MGKIDIRNGYIDKNGNLHVKVYDTYDFNPEEKDKPLIMAGKNKMLDVERDLQIYNDQLNDAQLPIFEKTFIKLKTVVNSSESNNSDNTITGGAASIEDEYVSDVTDNIQEYPSTLLHGGLQYYHNIDSTKDDNDYFVENEIEGDEGYTGDNIEIVIANKRKYDEEQKKKALEQEKQNPISKAPLHVFSAGFVLYIPNGYKITSGYGKRTPPVPGASDFHNGWDINFDFGTPVKSVADGKVIAVGPARGYGKWVAIDHGRINGIRVTSEYGHISRWCVSYGQQVRQGQIIAYSGNEGFSSGPHLHITIREGDTFQGKAVDPSKYLELSF